VTLAECAFNTEEIGVEVSLLGASVARAAFMNQLATLFGESASRVIVSVSPDRLSGVLELAAASRVPARPIGRTGGHRLRMSVGDQLVVDLSIRDAERAWASALERYFSRRVA
jgi:phosphoribosylformylglycinamidine synthase